MRSTDSTRPNFIQVVLRASLLCTLGACTAVGPDYVTPDLQTPDLWANDLTGAQDSDPALLAQWWTQLKDPILSGLIVRAMADNLDLAQAMSRIEEARALRGLSRAQLAPDFDVTGSGSRSRSLGGTTKVDAWQSELTMAWELDVAGGLRRALEASDADLDQATELCRDIRVMVAAEVASAYVDVRNFQARLKIAQDNIEIQQKSLKLARQRLEQGASSALDPAQAASNLANTEASVPSLTVGLRRSMHRLGVLLGQHPSALYAELKNPTPVPSIPDELTTGIPANLLRQRPDLRAAERALAAQTARVGVAVADLYPRFFLPGSTGLGAVRGQPFAAAGTNDIWSLGLGFSWNLFEFGRVRRNIEVQEKRVDQALLAYESTLLRALEEVENALVLYSRQGLRRAALEKGVAASRLSVDLSNQRYGTGVDDFQRVLDAERTLFAVQDALQVSLADQVQALISLYLALGGGWQAVEGDPQATQGIGPSQTQQLNTLDQH